MMHLIAGIQPPTPEKTIRNPGMSHQGGYIRECLSQKREGRGFFTAKTPSAQSLTRNPKSVGCSSIFLTTDFTDYTDF